jgi:hypothetical protein
MFFLDLELLNNSKTFRDPSLGQDLSMHVSSNPSRDPALLKHCDQFSISDVHLRSLECYCNGVLMRKEEWK